MDHDKTYTVELTIEEIYSLRECLKFVRKRIDEDYQDDGLDRRQEPIQNPVFVAASKLAFKLAKVENPDTKVTLQDFLNYGNYGLNN
ncbi:MAG: hypothetical protein AAFP18_02175 [Bacteroidota bacterium]